MQSLIKDIAILKFYDTIRPGLVNPGTLSALKVCCPKKYNIATLRAAKNRKFWEKSSFKKETIKYWDNAQERSDENVEVRSDG